MNDAWMLNGRTALVTGASRGLGFAIADEFASLGANLVLVARGREGLLETEQHILNTYPDCRVQTVAADVSTEAGRDKVVNMLPRNSQEPNSRLTRLLCLPCQPRPAAWAKGFSITGAVSTNTFNSPPASACSHLARAFRRFFTTTW